MDRFFDVCDLKPHPLPSIPDDPPPHEGAMIDLPFVVEPPDLILVEVLEALPGPADLGRAAGQAGRDDQPGLLRARST